ncbi:UDP-N-acetylmuramoyl-L-alanyl-D-glutamate--2,6-diaminopimelate ligase [Limosilactobacillus sp.]|uniref:UDP-N-acetylmuramoyl-L-alanyl-D-glutamate--2, 6-diaminopimelate ligase n=1 Tax=Limosilactobacillus sp. TaxID=2773925 RepID=UPI00345EC3E0
MQLSSQEALVLLREHDLLVKVVHNKTFTANDVHYDSRQVTPGSLFFCKGRTKPEYLASARQKGAIAYVAPQEDAAGGDLPGIIVNDEDKAMALLSAAFFGFPQDQLFLIGITGTKGKTTTAYFAYDALRNQDGKQVALLSTVNSVLGPKPEDTFKSALTTPESLDLFRDMRRAVDNGMDHMVMEVSSQAYLRNRVYGLKFDVGIFLNIFPDHIGRNEHPNFANYQFCKEQLMVNSRRCIINADDPHFKDFYATAKSTTDPENIFVFGRPSGNSAVPLDFSYEDDGENLHGSNFTLKSQSQRAKDLAVDGDYNVDIAGDYNEGNATAAIIASGMAGTKPDAIAEALEHTRIPGRMDMLTTKDHGTVYIDYAHDYISVKRLVAFLRQQTHVSGRVIILLGATGDKGISRREGFGKALSEEKADVAILTTDDPGFEDPKKIDQEIDSHIDHSRVGKVEFIMDRQEAIEHAISHSTPADIVVLAGKGDDHFQKIKGKNVPYPSDITVAEDTIKKLEH